MYTICERKTSESGERNSRANRELLHTHRREELTLLTCFSQVDLQIQCNTNKKFSKVFCNYQQTDSKVYMERQKDKKETTRGQSKSED